MEAKDLISKPIVLFFQANTTLKRRLGLKLAERSKKLVK